MVICGRLWSVAGGLWSFSVVYVRLLVVCGRFLLVVVVCGGLWWFAGGLWSFAGGL